MVLVYEVQNIYPKRVFEIFKVHKHIGRISDPNATGKSVVFECGTYVVFELLIERETRTIAKAGFRSNGCGFLIATAEIACAECMGRCLTDLHGLKDLPQAIVDKLEGFPDERLHCLHSVIDGLKNAFVDFRHRQIEEFAGEKALICTCFGISEESIEDAIKNNAAGTVERVGKVTNAGTGCGSCQLLIQEIIDSADATGQTR